MIHIMINHHKAYVLETDQIAEFHIVLTLI